MASPQPILRPDVEDNLWVLMQKGLAANRWRADYDEWAQKRLWAEKHQRSKIELFEKWLGPLSGKRVLDLGTGRGGLSVALLWRGADVVALDLRRRNCRLAKLRASRYDLAVNCATARGEKLPFAPGSFDLVICKDVLEHVADPDAVLQELARVLKQGGSAFVTFINRLAWDDPHYHIHGINFLPRPMAEVVIQMRGRGKSNIRDVQRLSDMHYYTLGQANRAAARAGLSYVDVTGEKRKQLSKISELAHRHLSISAGTFEAFLKKP